MKGGEKPHGYTIVEVLIFLAVSGALTVSALLLVGGQQSKTEFTQSTRELESRILDIINDVSVGYYPTTGNVRCNAKFPIGTGITLTAGATTQGTNAGCTFIGRIIQFAPQGTDGRKIRVYTIAGQRQITSTKEVSNIQEAKAKLIATSTIPGDTTPDLFEDFDIGPLRIAKVTSPPNPPAGAVGFITTFNQYSGASLDSGSTSADLAADITGATALNQVPQVFVDTVNALLLSPTASNLLNPTAGVTICVLSLGTNQHALLKIGGDYRRLTTQLTFRNGNNASDCP